MSSRLSELKLRLKQIIKNKYSIMALKERSNGREKTLSCLLMANGDVAGIAPNKLQLVPPL